MQEAKEKQKKKNERGGEEMKNNGKRKHQKGITLIALVITIIVLLILAAVSIATLTGENGILSKASNAKVENAHAEVKEAMRLEYTNYVLEREQEETTSDLIGYLKDDRKIIEEPTEEGKYKIDAEKLLNKTPILGLGTDDKDIYMLEEVADESSTGNLGKIASTEVVKLAETTSSGKTYKIMYYGKTESENVELETLKDIEENEEEKAELITFKVTTYSSHTSYEEGSFAYIYTCTAEKDMTWEDYIKSKYNSKEWCHFVDGNDSEEYWSKMYINEENNVEIESGNGFFIRSDGWGKVDSSELIVPDGDYVNSRGGECVYPDSNILVSKDGKTIQAKDIKQGNDIAYYNFNTKQVEIGIVEKAYIHKQATNFVRYKFEDGSYLEATDYHPIYTKEGWKSYTRRNGYEIPKVGDEVKTEKGWKKLTKIESFEGLEDCYDFVITGANGEKVDNYFANATLVQGSY